MVAEVKSQSEAARKLGSTQPIVSRNLGNLNIWLGRSLFDSTVPARLSADGEQFLETAKAVVALLENSRAKPEVEGRKPSIKDFDMSQYRKTKTNEDGTA